MHCDPRFLASFVTSRLSLCSLCTLHCSFFGLFMRSYHVSLSFQSMLSNYLVLRKMSHVGMWWSMLSDKQHTSIFCVFDINLCLSVLLMVLFQAFKGRCMAPGFLFGTDSHESCCCRAQRVPWAKSVRLWPSTEHIRSLSMPLPLTFLRRPSCQSSDMLWSYSPSYWQWKATLGWGFGLLKL